jgi:type VI secretion system protein ImpC
MSNEAEREAAAGAQTLEGDSLLDEILAETKMAPGDEGYEVAKAGVQAFIAELVQPKREGEKVDKALVDAMIAEIDHKLSKQIDEILHNSKFQQIEAAWRGLKFVIDRVDFRENIKVELLNVSKEDLLMDFEDSPEIPKSGMYKIVYSAEYGQFGGKPYGLLVANYDFGPGPQDIALLQNCAAVATMAHAPFLAAAASQFFGLEDYLTLPNMKDLKAVFEGPQYTKWQSFRESEDARYVGLCMPRFLLRLPFGSNTVPVKAFNYEEDVVGAHEKYLWGNAAFALATRVADSFAKYRWCPNIIGPQAGGTVENLPLHQYEAMGEIQTKIPTEIMLTERREYELSEEGFIGLTFRKDSDNACFFSANSCQKAKYFGQSEEGRDAELNFRLGTQLPYLFITCRLAHYIKVLQREQIGTWKERADLERELNKWIGQYVADQDVISPAIRGRRPLRKASISVTEVPGNAGWYKVDMKVRPHFKYMGAFFTLGLVGKLDKQ